MDFPFNHGYTNNESVHTYAHTYLCMIEHMPTCMHAYVHASPLVCMPKYIHALKSFMRRWKLACEHIHTHTHIYIYIYIYILSCIRKSMHAWMRMYYLHANMKLCKQWYMAGVHWCVCPCLFLASMQYAHVQVCICIIVRSHTYIIPSMFTFSSWVKIMCLCPDAYVYECTETCIDEGIHVFNHTCTVYVQTYMLA